MTPEELVAYAEGLSRIAAAGGGPKAFAAHLARELGAAVFLEDGDGKHIAAAGNTSAAPPTIKDVQRNGRPSRVLPVTLGDAVLGTLAVVGDGAAAADQSMLRLTASAIAVELAREDGGGHGRTRTFWQRLIDGAYADAASARDDAAARGITLAPHYVAVSLELEGAEEATAGSDFAELRRIAAQAFAAPDASVALLDSAGALLLLVPAPREVDGANIRTAAALFPRTLAKKAAHARVSGGVGARCPMLSLGRSVQEAGIALIVARRMYGAGHVMTYGDLGVYPLLYAGAQPEALSAFAQLTLEPLRAYDEKHQTELVRTLELYFSAGENVKTAAAALNVHRHTVFYRLRQIAEICRCSLEDPHAQLTLRLATALDALLK